MYDNSKHAAYYQQYYEKSLVPYSASNYGYDVYPQNYYGYYPTMTMTPGYYNHIYGQH
jgi:hypothetical protein